MAGPTGGASLLESGAESRLITRICRSLQGAKLGQHIAIRCLKAGPVGPNGGKRARSARAAASRETRRKAFEKPDHVADRSARCAGVTALIHYGLDAFHLPRDPLKAILPGGNNISLCQGRAREGSEGSKDGGALPKFHVTHPALFEEIFIKDPNAYSGNADHAKVGLLTRLRPSPPPAIAAGSPRSTSECSSAW